MADTTLFGRRPSAYRFTNTVLHAAAGVFLFLALNSLTDAFWPSLVVAGIFLFHPLRPSSVVWIAERKDVLSGFFWFLGLWTYGQFVRKPNIVGYAFLLLCFVCGMLSKFMMVTFPFVLLLLDFWPLRRFGITSAEARGRAWPLVREKIPFFLATIAFIYFTSAALNSKGAFHEAQPLGMRAPRICENYFFYITKVLWPASLSIAYPIRDLQPWMAVSGGVLLLGISLLCWRSMWKYPWGLVGWLWFVGTLIPVIGLVTFGHFFVADRYTYIPSVGLSIALVFSVTALMRHFQLSERIGFVAGAGILLACAAATIATLPNWRAARPPGSRYFWGKREGR